MKAPTLTIRAFSLETGVAQATLKGRLTQAKVDPVSKTLHHDDLYRVRDLVRAYLGGDFAAERLREMKERADKLFLENEKTRGRYIAVEDVARFGERVCVAMRQIILNSSLLPDEQDAVLLNLRSLKDKDWSKP